MSLVRLCFNSASAIRAIPAGASRLQLIRTCQTSPSPPAPVKVLYDGLCPICAAEIRFLQFVVRKRPRKVDFVDISLPGYDGAKYNGVSYEMAMAEMHVIDENNTVHRGVPAFDVMYSAVGLGWVGRLLMWPPIRPLMDKSYDIFARNRLKWTGRGNECTSGRCEKKANWTECSFGKPGLKSLPTVLPDVVNY